MVTSMKSKVLVFGAVLLLAGLLPTVGALAQKKLEKPKLHSDFYFGTYPVVRDNSELVSKENSRLLLVGFHQGWGLEKIAKESKIAEEDLEGLFADLEEAKLATQIDEFETRPMLPVIRDKDIEKVQRDLRAQAQSYTKLIQSNWPQIETHAASLTGAKGVPKGQLLYQIVVGGILFGGMHDSFFEDQTLMVTPPRRAGSLRYFAWLAESDPALAGTLKREQWESDAYTLVSIGRGMAKDRMRLDQLRTANGMVLDEAEARRYRSFVAIFTRDKLLPYFKKDRSNILRVLNQLDAGRYISVSSAFAWYYDQVANLTAEQLVSAGLIQSPAAAGGQYVYAIKAPTR
jgi:hypothetical protein